MFNFIMFSLISSVPLWILLGIHKIIKKYWKNIRKEYFLYPGLVIAVSLSISYFSLEAATFLILIAALFAIVRGILAVVWRNRPDKNKPLIASLITSVISILFVISFYSITMASNLSFLILLFLLMFGIVTFKWRDKYVSTGKKVMIAMGATTSVLALLLVLLPLAAAFFLLILILVL
ncbi:hypothetical protein [Bacillus sp. FJAT-27245]|uniref:hypothetical protein n=1 Tax=Bacillus sp. FJAT-27245 TaxID=1684144 RepID=UPI0006A78C9F|nr:hypothetical protein [Bacillus sp. FJAT-27245]